MNIGITNNLCYRVEIKITFFSKITASTVVLQHQLSNFPEISVKPQGGARFVYFKGTTSKKVREGHLSTHLKRSKTWSEQLKIIIIIIINYIFKTYKKTPTFICFFFPSFIYLLLYKYKYIYYNIN